MYIPRFHIHWYNVQIFLNIRVLIFSGMTKYLATRNDQLVSITGTQTLVKRVYHFLTLVNVQTILFCVRKWCTYLALNVKKNNTLILCMMYNNVRLENMKTRYKIGTSFWSSILFFQIFFEASLLLYLCYKSYNMKGNKERKKKEKKRKLHSRRNYNELLLWKLETVNWNLQP